MAETDAMIHAEALYHLLTLLHGRSKPGHNRLLAPPRIVGQIKSGGLYIAAKLVCELLQH